MELQKPRYDNNQWLWEFTVLVILTGTISGISYFIQGLIFISYPEYEDSTIPASFDLIRAIRMTCFYVIPSVMFVKRWNGTLSDTGIYLSKDHRSVSIISGISVYLVAAYIFLRYEIFFEGWVGLENTWLWVRFILVAFMAAITDFWTRGFILFEISKKFGDKIAIIGQNITWFTIHIYEIELLTPYIGVWLAIGLTLFLGFGGDLVALKTRSIVGLMIGHVILNLLILLAANNLV